MTPNRRSFLRAAVVGLPAVAVGQEPGKADPLPSWNDGKAKKAITEFVAKTTREGGPDFVPPADRLAVFDNDGTLWCEQPMYVQLAFALDRVKALADGHPEWKGKEPFRSVLAGDLAGVAVAGEKGLVELILATHTGMTVVHRPVSEGGVAASSVRSEQTCGRIIWHGGRPQNAG